ATNAKVTWTSSNTSVATVTYGVVAPLTAGTATITARTEDGGYTATSTVTVSDTAVPVTGVTVTPGTLSLTAGGAPGALTATVAPANATNPKVIWTSSNTSVATVTYGVVTPLTAGTATITARTEDGNYTAASTVIIASSMQAPVAPTNLRATAGDGQAALRWNPVAGATEYRIYQSLVSGNYGTAAATVGGSVYGYTATGLANGTSYYYTVKAANSAGVSGASNEAAAIPMGAPDRDNDGVTPNVPGTSGGSGAGSPTTVPTEPSAPSAGVEVLVNGKTETAGTATTTKVNDRTVTTITVDPQKLEQRLAAAGPHTIITIPVNTNSDVIVGVLNGQLIKSMEQQQAVVEIRSGNGSYTLPAGLVNIDAISAQLGTAVRLQDIEIRIRISSPADGMVKVVESAAAQGGFSLVAPPLEFAVSGTYGNETIEVTRFDAYVERTIAIPDDVDPNKITTAVVIDSDGTVRHVPTIVVRVDGKYYARINSLTNSTYSVVWHPREYNDVADHWSKDAVNDMGSRMVIQGSGEGLFNPDRNITRAEFAAIIVRGLGLRLDGGAASFSDVKGSDWYYSAIRTAYDYKLISGFEDGRFRPNDNITREQAMTIVAKAMAITGLKAKLAPKAAEDSLSAYTDAATISEWAKNGIADSVAAGIVSGREGAELAPEAFITRAEVAAIIQRLLQKSELI
ncbi:hypothetical protein FE784_17240, partial [Paenibacillus hemerocallicola]